MRRLFIFMFGEVPVINLLHLLIVGLIAFAVFGGLWWLFGEIALIGMLALMLVMILVGQATAYFNQRQTEALMSLHALIEPRAPLPAFRSWNITPDLSVEYAAVLLDREPALVVELGAGVSSIVGGYVMERIGSGRIVGFDHKAEFARGTADTVRRHGLEGIVEVRHAPLERVEIGGRAWQWYAPEAFADLEDIDVLFIDGPPNTTGLLARYPALPMLMDRLGPGAVIVLDDAARVMEQAAIRRWRRDFPGLSVYRTDTKGGGAVMRLSGDSA
jgi:predicted O-methyltransferase YrrM